MSSKPKHIQTRFKNICRMVLLGRENRPIFCLGEGEQIALTINLKDILAFMSKTNPEMDSRRDCIRGTDLKMKKIQVDEGDTTESADRSQ